MHASRRTRDTPGGRAYEPAGEEALLEGELLDEELGYDDDDQPGEEEPRLTAMTAGQAARRHIAGLVGKPIEGVIMVAPSGDGWTVEVEVVEDRRVPSSGDTLAIYAAQLDRHGDLVSYARARTYKRAKGDTGRPGAQGGV
ncbi:gas vesicle protein GvpO [Sphaerisporangium aureirubrum]|uniref:Gas vesicle protein n=1 Tax=Sphaerisporangium aureirubrum TaxID=1544736 RepID=A0ABW1NUZ7_9ACTN